jgi:hypothetical protein
MKIVKKIFAIEPSYKTKTIVKDFDTHNHLKENLQKIKRREIKSIDVKASTTRLPAIKRKKRGHPKIIYNE